MGGSPKTLACIIKWEVLLKNTCGDSNKAIPLPLRTCLLEGGIVAGMHTRLSWLVALSWEFAQSLAYKAFRCNEEEVRP